jgi:hypothetical protein
MLHSFAGQGGVEIAQCGQYMYGYCEEGREIVAEYGRLHVLKSNTIMQVSNATDVCKGGDRPRAK